MGNAQSTQQHHSSHKLAKPKANVNIVPRVESHSSLASQYAHLSASERQKIKLQLLSPLETEFEHSWDDDSKPGNITANAQHQTSDGSRTNSISCFGSSRNSSSKLKSLPSSKVSLVTSQAVDLETAMKILEEVKRTASPEDLAALQQALQTCQPSPSPSTTATDQNLSRRSSIFNRSTSSLFRRRSLLSTPGLSNRDSPAEKNRRTWNSWKTPQVDPQEEAKWRSDIVGATQAAALDMSEEKEAPPPRAQTPGDMEYTHLGSIQLGSLRIANGPPSPTASAKFFPQQTSHFRVSQEEDDFTEFDPSDSLMMKPAKRRHARSKSAVAPAVPPLYRKLRLSSTARKAKTMSRIDSSLKTEAVTSAETPTPTTQTFDDCEPEPVRRLRVMNKSADTLATIATLANEHQAASADAQAEEGSHILEGALFAEPLASEETELNSQNTPPQQSPATRRPPPTKTDSGYASEGSFVTVKRRALTLREASPIASQQPSMATGVLQGGSSSDERGIYTVQQMLRDPTSSRPSAPAGDVARRRHTLLQVKTPATVESRLSSLRSRRAGDCDLPTPKSTASRAVSYHTSEMPSPNTPLSFASKFSNDSKTLTWSRLHKRWPSHQELPFVQACESIPEQPVPSVPTGVRKQLVRRISETPGMSWLTSKGHGNEQNGKAEAVAGVSTKSPTCLETAEQRGRQERTSMESPRTPSPRGLRRSLSLFRNKSKAKKEKEKEAAREKENVPPVPAVIDLGTIGTALGQSPYDAAMLTAPRRRNTAPSQADEPGNAVPRVRSLVGMDAQTAAEFARTHSKDRASLRPEMPRRPKSYHVNMNAGEASPMRRRSPNSYSSDVPPMPTLQRRPSTAAPAAPAAPSVPTTTDSATHARSSGRGRVVSEMGTKYDQYGQSRPSKEEWEAYARLQSQRRQSVGEQTVRRSHQRSQTMSERSRPPSVGMNRGYTGYGERPLHSYVNNRKSGHYGVELFNVPMSLQRA
ncbi:hypothetical protein P280DRAFT_133695 [Massarina eburnea CBS 473.64]|uniref:Uncharacterized protein n=1 Tax=Massarina eburnea CBS 473.64 TaxID=1395130 RepID=A0A6A6SDM3_9PLEO|nr:hypothetical protein P280DRAFT_133695 [Massarina eburnea CBS 473.64]